MINKMELTKKERDTLIAVGDSGNNAFPLRLVDLSLLLKVKPPTALNLVRRLSRKGCLKDEKGMIIFTDKGKKAYLELVENHRVEEPVPDLHTHYICLPLFIREFCMFIPCEFLYWMFPWFYEIMLFQYPVYCGR